MSTQTTSCVVVGCDGSGAAPPAGSTLRLHPAGPCLTSSAVLRGHTWVPGDSETMIAWIAYGRPGQADYGLSVELGRCRYCGCALLALDVLDSADPGAEGSLPFEVRGVEL